MLSLKEKGWWPHVLPANILTNYQAGKHTEIFDKKEGLHLQNFFKQDIPGLEWFGVSGTSVNESS